MATNGAIATANGKAASDPHLPREHDAERYYLGCFISYPDRAGELLALGISNADFVDPYHAEIFNVFAEQYRQGAIDIGRARVQLKPRASASDLSRDYFDELSAEANTTAFAPIEVAKIVEARRKRQRIEGLEAALDDARNGHTCEQIDDLLFATIDDWKREREATAPRDTFTLADLATAYPTLKPPLIDGLARVGEVINVIANTKVGKSWFVYYLALCVITGRYLFGRFKTTRGKVCIVDNELHAETLASRLLFIASAMGIAREDVEQELIIKTLRGNLRSFGEVASELREQFEPGEFVLIVFDAKYRFAEQGQSENDNASEARFYNEADRFAAAMQAAVAFVHHATKGSQTEKRVSDVGAGAGSQSRAADVHAIFREHEDDGAFVFEALVRSFAPVQPIGLRWQFPQFVPDDDIEPTKLKGRLKPSEQRQSEQDREAINKIIDAIRKDGAATTRVLRGRVGLGRDKLQRLLDKLQSEDQLTVTQTNIRGNECNEYALSKTEV